MPPVTRHMPLASALNYLEASGLIALAQVPKAACGLSCSPITSHLFFRNRPFHIQFRQKILCRGDADAFIIPVE